MIDPSFGSHRFIVVLLQTITCHINHASQAEGDQTYRNIGKT